MLAKSKGTALLLRWSFGLFLVLQALCGFAQNGKDARELLNEVAAASRNLQTYRAEGRIAMQLLMTGPPVLDLTFRVETQAPNRFRIELSAGPEWEWITGFPVMMLCEGHSGWMYQSKAKLYEKLGPGNPPGDQCAPFTLLGFEHVADELRSAEITGTGHAQFEGRSQPCTMVQAQYRVVDGVMLFPGMNMKVGRVSRTMCIDAARKLILTDHIEAEQELEEPGGPSHLEQTVTYQRIERNPTLKPGTFEFHPPADAKERVEPVPATTAAQPAAEPAANPQRGGNYTPTVISRTGPEYTQEAWDEGIQGIVVVSAEIGPDGAISNIRVEKSLGYGLDEKAVECFRQWRFSPGTENGSPVRRSTEAGIVFALPDKRPEKPSAGPVTRPVPPPRLPAVTLQRPTDLDDFYLVTAINLKAPEICAKISASAEGNGGSQRGYQIQTMQAECYMQLAGALHDPGLCDHVKPVRTEYRDGSKVDKSYCVAQMNENRIATPYDIPAFAKLMQKAGYDDNRIINFRYNDGRYNSPGYVTYRNLIEDPNLLSTLRRAPSYAEPPSPAKVRPANPVEYLYQAVAVDKKVPELCAKVSANATYTDPFKQTVFLRSNCYFALAHNELNQAFCDQLPQAGTSPYVKYDSREECHHTVEIFSRPNLPKDGLTMGPADFPDPWCLGKALKEIGYSDARKVDQALKPKPNDYWDFLVYVSLWGTKEDRAEFTQRVMDLK